MGRLSQEDRVLLDDLVRENGIDKLKEYISHTFTPTLIKIRRITPEKAHEWIDLQAFAAWLVSDCQQRLRDSPLPDDPESPQGRPAASETRADVPSGQQPPQSMPLQEASQADPPTPKEPETKRRRVVAFALDGAERVSEERPQAAADSTETAQRPASNTACKYCYDLSMSPNSTVLSSSACQRCANKKRKGSLSKYERQKRAKSPVARKSRPRQFGSICAEERIESLLVMPTPFRVSDNLTYVLNGRRGSMENWPWSTMGAGRVDGQIARG